MATAVKALAPERITKTLDDIKLDMSELYEQVKSGATDLKLAAELANITGKYLKAVQLDLATEIFLSHQQSRRIGSPANGNE